MAKSSFTKSKGKRVVELRASGETLTAIAKRYKTTVPTIRRWIEKVEGTPSNGAPSKAKRKATKRVAANIVNDIPVCIVVDRSKIDLTDDAQFRWLCFGVQKGIINPS